MSLSIICYKSNICHNHRDYRSSYCLFTEPSAPYIQINVSKTLRVVERTAVRLPCFATGSPKPSVKWWSDDRKGSLPCIIKFNGTCHDLACINFTCYWNVTVSRNMTYWCEAKNKYGVIGRNVSVEVLGDMSWFMCHNPTNIYLFKVNNRSTRKRYEICSKRQWLLLTLNILHSGFSSASLVDFEQVNVCWKGKCLVSMNLKTHLQKSETFFQYTLKDTVKSFCVYFYTRLDLQLLSCTLHLQVSIQLRITG